MLSFYWKCALRLVECVKRKLCFDGKVFGLPVVQYVRVSYFRLVMRLGEDTKV